MTLPPPSLRGATAWRLLAAVVLLVLLWVLREPLLLVFGAVLVAATLRALAGPLVRHAGLRPRWAVLLVMATLLLLAGLGLWQLGAPLAEQLQTLRSALPQAWDALRAWLERAPLGSRVLQGLAELQRADMPWKDLAGLATGAAAALSALLLIGLMGIYLALDMRQYRDGLVRLAPPARRLQIGHALDASGQALTRWLLGQGVMMLAIGVTVSIGLLLLGMPLALALGLIAGLLEFVPFFGPIAAGTLAVMLAFVQGPTEAFYVALLFIGLQQLEGNVLVPLVQRWAVDLPPVLALAGVLVFGVLFGPLGVVFGTPLTVVAMVLVERLYVQQALEGAPA